MEPVDWTGVWIYLDYAKAPPEDGKHSYDEDMVNILHSAKFGEFFVEVAKEKGVDVRFSHPGAKLDEMQMNFVLDHLGVERG